MSVKIAVRPHYVTRKAIEDPLFKEDKFVDIIACDNVDQAHALLNTAHLALFVGNTFYPVDETTLDAQFALVAAGENPTVTADAYFGWVKAEDYCSAVNLAASANAEYKKIMGNVELYNGIVRGNVFYVANASDVSVAAVNKAGFWFAFNFDKTNAEANVASDYSAEKVYMLKTNNTKTNLANGINVVYLGATEEDAKNDTFCITATVALKTDAAATAVSVTYDVAFENKLHFVTLVSASEVSTAPGIEHKDLETEYAITYVMNGGKWIPGDEVKTTYKASDEKSYYPPIPVLKGAKFLHWTPTNIGAGSTGAVTFEAVFDKDPIYYTLNGGHFEEGAEVLESYGAGDLPYTPPTPVKEGFEFGGWNPANIPAGSIGAKTLVAVWNSITYDLDGGSWAEGDVAKTTYKASDLPYTPPTPVKPNYGFIRWNPETVAAGSTGAVTMAAVWGV